MNAPMQSVLYLPICGSHWANLIVLLNRRPYSISEVDYPHSSVAEMVCVVVLRGVLISGHSVKEDAVSCLSTQPCIHPSVPGCTHAVCIIPSICLLCFHQVLKIAILAEIFAPDSSWYVDTMLNLVRWAGDYVSEEVWHRVIQVIINRDDVQGYAAKTCFEVRAQSVTMVSLHHSVKCCVVPHTVEC